MPTLFSKLNNRTANKASSTRFAPAVSSTDLALFPSTSPTSHDAREIRGTPNVNSLPTAHDSRSNSRSVESPFLSEADGTVLTERSTNLNKLSELRGEGKTSDATQGRLGEFGQHHLTLGRSASTIQAPRRTPAPVSSPKARMYKTLPSKPLASHVSLPQAGKNASSATNGGQGGKPIRTGVEEFSQTAESGEVHPPTYGYTSLCWDKQLDVPKVAELVLVCGEQIRMRGLTLPLIFSSMALDLSHHNVTSLIRAYLTSPKEFYGSETKFANPHDLAAVVKWSLSRLGRVFPVPVPVDQHAHHRRGDVQDDSILVHQRGFLELDSYITWSAYERNASYPIAAFSTFLDGLTSSCAALLVAIFSLLSSTTSYSLRNGMTPTRLARLFGVLMFGVPEDESFERTYDAYIKVSNATEHLLLAYIRDMSTMEPLPTRLADHVRGYPHTLARNLSKPGNGVRGVPFTMVSRSVRLYSVDLVQQACDLRLEDQSPEWAACCGKGSDGCQQGPLLSDRYRKLINLRATKREAGIETGSDAKVDGQSSERGKGRLWDKPSAVPELEAYSSLADKAWDEFMSEGFAAPDRTKLVFDLRESERKERMQERMSVQWSQFEESGFSLKDDGLASVLAFDDLLQQDVQRWPEERAELLEKIRRTNKAMPTFNYDTAPYVVSSPSLCGEAQGQWQEKPYSRMDEVFPEVFADILLGNGWSNRDELTHRNANFVVVQFKSRPTPSTVGSQSINATTQTTSNSDAKPDDRSDAAWFVIEEVVPAQYRSELEAIGRKKNRSRASIRNLVRFRRRKDLTIQTDDNSFFDDVFRPGSGGTTKKVSLRDAASNALVNVDEEKRGSQASVVPITIASPISEEGFFASNVSSSVRLLTTLKSRTSKKWRTKGAGPSRVEEGGEHENVDRSLPPPPPPKDPTVVQSGSWDSVDFETRSLHDAEMDAFAMSDKRRAGSLLKGAMTKTERRQSKDDTWLDIMVRADNMRIPGQDGTFPKNLKQSHLGFSTSLVAGDSSVPHEGWSASPFSERQQKEEDGSSSKPQLQASGWSREDAPSPSLPSKKSEKERSGAVDTTVVKRGIEVRAGGEGKEPASSKKLESAEVKPKNDKSSDLHTLDDAEGENASSTSSLRHLRALPPRSAGIDGERERAKARDERIEAAKERARQLRANLDPVAMGELERKRVERSSLPREVDQIGDASDAREHLTPVKDVGSAIETSTGTVSPTDLSPSRRLSARDDPFAKDRFSGRVASLTSKFGGQTNKALSPQSTGDESSDAIADTATSKAPVPMHKSTNTSTPTRSPYKAMPSDRRNTSPSPTGQENGVAGRSGSISLKGQGAGKNNNETFKAYEKEAKFAPTGAERDSEGAVSGKKHQLPSPSTHEDAHESGSRRSSESIGAIGADTDSIYPEDAASNFSRDTNPEEDSVPNRHHLRLTEHAKDFDAQGPSSSSPSLFGNLDQSPAKAGAQAAAALSSQRLNPVNETTVSILTADQLRAEEEDRATAMPPGFGLRYQPGMPLSNVEEERESVMSGSNA